jgi:hypothetical protein
MIATVEDMKRFNALPLAVRKHWVKAQIDVLRSELETLHLIGQRDNRIARAKEILRVLAQPHNPALWTGYLYTNELDQLGFTVVLFDEEDGQSPRQDKP